ncbi:hypothetical protein SAY87_011281 [Trapa incisa]|uniref:SPARK domain-containing protein n=1 Tax=Trapa incisa TaxID=236973 RepID=A0AAN7JI74_9MYRT|nr:hypothetical protein SAY87_011281 [Trapa incisa]
MALYRALECLAFLAMQLPAVIAECPLDLSRSNYTLVASICYKDGRAKCCRYINACIAVSVASYTNRTRTMGVASDLALICLQSIEETLELYGVPRNAIAFCGLGTKITVNYECMGQITVTQMMQAAGFHSVSENCGRATMAESSCRKCVSAGIVYLRHLTGTVDNITLSTCRDAAFVALASQFDGAASINFANCFFGVECIIITSVSNTSQPPSPSYAFWKPPVADGPSQLMLGTPLNQTHHSYHLTLVPGLGIAVMVLSVLILVILLLLIRRTRRELEVSEDIYGASSKVFPPIYTKKIQEGQAFMFYKFSYRETKKATEF